MNHIYSLIWNPATQSYCPAPEFAHSRHKGRNSKLVLALAIAAIAGGAQAAPTGGDVVSGGAAISVLDTTTVIDQTTDAVTINWQGFDIGADEIVTFYQPDANSLALNRVLSGNGTEILGQLNANGRVFILDANGVLFGETAQVNVGSLVASTLDLSAADFADNHFEFSGSGNPAAVTNLGRITVADTGAVALLGGQVTNHGVIRARLGNVALAAGNQITLDFAGDGLLNVKIDEGTAQALVHNGGLIQADGGSVLMTAHASDALLQTVVNNTGVIEARTLQEHDGKIMLLGGFNGGTVSVSGTLDASAPTGGDGGFIDTSGAIVKVQADARVTTAAPEGQVGTWLIDPTDIAISYDPLGANDNVSHIHTHALQESLALSNVVVQTQGAGGQDGNITIVDPIIWASGAILTLDAHNDIAINNYIHAPGGGLVLDAGGAITTGLEGHLRLASFNLLGGDWSQIAANLPIFNVDNFMLNGGTFTRALDGDGTDTPLQITDIYGLQGLVTTLGTHAVLVNDIDASGTANWYAGNEGFLPIGDDANSFTGSLDGNGFVIDSLTINRPTQDFVGLFGRTNGASLTNVALENVDIAGYWYVGGLVGSNSGGTITQSYATGAVMGNDAVGGLAGSNSGSTIAQSYATTAVAAIDVLAQGNRLGGLVGSNSGTITQSYATGAVAGRINVGGLVGWNTSSGNITQSYATGLVTGETSVGGLVGDNDGTVNSSYWDGFTTNQFAQGVGGGGGTFDAFQINGDWNDGGVDAYNQTSYEVFGQEFDFINTWFIAEGSSRPMLRAFLDGGNISNLYQLQGMAADLAGDYVLTRDIDASATAASVTAGNDGNYSDIWGGRGFAPVGDDPFVLSPFTGTLDGQGFVISNLTINRDNRDYVGLFGGTAGDASLSRVGLVDNHIVGGNYTGALVGRNEFGSISISSSYATGAVEGNDYVGGLVGRNESGSISSSYATGAVEGNNYVGGLVGWHIVGSISSSYATGAVEGNDHVGGLVGWNIGSISSSYATGAVGGNNFVGGLVGWSEFDISSSYATGSVQGDLDVGGLVGVNIGSISSSYWDGDTTGRGDTGVGIGNPFGVFRVDGDWDTSPTAYNRASYEEVGHELDFDNVWFIAEGSSRPMLRAFLNYTTSGGTYQITNALQLQGMVADLAGNYVLMNDIDASVIAATGNTADVWGGRGFAPVGSYDADFNLAFNGSLDGNGHVITGLVSNRPDQDYVGLFGRTGEDAEITNVGLVNVNLRGDDNVGAVVGWHWGAISNVYATGEVAAGSSQAGGIAGGNSGSITDSYAVVDVDVANNNVGGLVGLQDATGSITRAYASGSVAGSNNVGGLVGYSTGIITQSYWDTVTTGLPGGVGAGDGSGTTGLTTAEFTQLTSFSDWGGDINADGSPGAVWRIYEGQSAPLLRPFLTDIDVIAYDAEKVYDGAAFNGHHDINGTTGNGVRYGTDYAQFLAVFGENGTPYGIADDVGSADLIYTGDSQGAINADTYEIGIDGLHSHQQGYNILFNSGSLEITPASLVVDVTMGVNSASKVYGNPDPNFSWTIVSGILAPGDSATGTFSRTPGENVGGYTIFGTPTGDFASNYNVTVNNGTLTITPRPITISVADASKIYGNADPDFSWALTGGNLVFGHTLTGDFVRAPGENAGDYAIGANFSGALATGNYAITLNNGTLTIAPRDIVIDISSLDKIYGEADPEFAWTVTGDGLVEGDVLSGTLTRAPGENVGAYTISGLVDGDLANGNYTYTLNNGLLTISPRPVVLTADNLMKVYGDEDPELTWSITSGSLVGDDTLVVSVSREDGSNVGSYAIMLDAGGEATNSNYDLSLVDGQLQITPATLTVTANDVAAYWDLLPPFTATVEGLVNGDTETAVFGNSLSVISNLVIPVPGNYVLTPIAALIGENYQVNFVDGLLTLLSSNPGGNYIEALTSTQLPAREALGRERRSNIYEARPLLDGSEDGIVLHVLDGGVKLDPDTLAAFGIVFPEAVNFPVNSAVVNERYFGKLRDFVQQLKQYPNVQILVEGHTSSTGSLALNQRLSERRAEAVAKVLEDMGLESRRIRTEHFNYQRPVATNETPEGRYLNQRTEIVEDEQKR